MPSVGMRRTTRVFGARVLRSGRRLSSLFSEAKRLKVAEGDQWIELLDSSGGGSGGGVIRCKDNGWNNKDGLKQEITEMVVDNNSVGEASELRSTQQSGFVGNDKTVDRMWGSYYQRKRKRMNLTSPEFENTSNSGKDLPLEHRRYGVQFVRKQRRRKDSAKSPVLMAVVESCSSSSHWLVCFLNVVFRYMRRARLRIAQLFAFVISEPFALAFSSHGISFLKDSAAFKSNGICRIFGARCLIPLFAMDFSAAPLCFMYLHSRMLLKFAFVPLASVMCSDGMDIKDDQVIDDDDCLLCTLSRTDPPAMKRVGSGIDSSGRRGLPSINRSRKLASRTSKFRIIETRSIKKRRSLRLKTGRNSSRFHMQKANVASVSGLFSYRRDGPASSPQVSTRALRSSLRRRTTTNMKELKATLVELKQDIDSTSCCANILVIESDRCYREKGATVTLEMSAEKQWYLAVKKDGVAKYSIRPHKVMRPSCCNRVTHDIIWTEDISSWKLEFLNRQDWFLFKELYRVCLERNVQAPTVNTIPVPGVSEVTDECIRNIHFTRPDSYIKLKDDELSRALARRTAIYDMDSEDESWLEKFNNESFSKNELHECVSQENFELMIDGFERALFGSSDDCSELAIDLYLNLGRREAVETVYSYWMGKRKQKCPTLIRLFQLNQVRKGQLIPNNILRKKRSFKRQSSQFRREKQISLLQALGAEHDDAGDEHNAILKVEEAKAAASRSEGLAVVKRRRAQLLMENADLATYRAAMALGIAEAAQDAAADDAVSLFFFIME